MMAGSSVASKMMWTTCLLYLVGLQSLTPPGCLLSGLPSESQHGPKVPGRSRAVGSTRQASGARAINWHQAGLL